MNLRTFSLLIILGFTTLLSSQVNSVFNTLNNNTSNIVFPETILKGENNDIYIIATDYILKQFVIHADENNQVIWSKEILDSDEFAPVRINEAKIYNDHIYLLGYLPYPKYILTKLDMNGNLIWSRQLTPSSIATQYHLPSLEINSTQIVVSSSEGYSIDLFSLKEDGSENWIKSFNTDSALGKNPNFDIIVTPQGDIIGCAKAGSDMSIYCIAPNNSIKWSKRFVEQGRYTHIKSILQINNSHFLLCGYRVDPVMCPNGNGFYAIMDTSGTFIDYRVVNETSEIKNGIILNNGNILLESTAVLGEKVLIQISEEGNVVQCIKFSEANGGISSYNTIIEQNGYQYMLHNTYLQKLTDYNSFSCVNYLPITLTFQGVDPNSLPSSNYLSLHTGALLENNTSISVNNADIELIVVCQSMAGIEDQETHSIHLYPTILHNTEMININHDISGSIEYHICDMTGKMVMQNQLTGNTIQINGLGAGLYVIRFASNGNMIHSDKFVVTE